MSSRESHDETAMQTSICAVARMRRLFQTEEFCAGAQPHKYRYYIRDYKYICFNRYVGEKKKKIS